LLRWEFFELGCTCADGGGGHGADGFELGHECPFQKMKRKNNSIKKQLIREKMIVITIV
jgi:hypothetical protein